MESSGSWRAVGRIGISGNAILGVRDQRKDSKDAQSRTRFLLHRLTNLMALTSAVVVGRSLSGVGRNLIAVALDMTEFLRNL